MASTFTCNFNWTNFGNVYCVELAHFMNTPAILIIIIIHHSTYTQMSWVWHVPDWGGPLPLSGVCWLRFLSELLLQGPVSQPCLREDRWSGTGSCLRGITKVTQEGSQVRRFIVSHNFLDYACDFRLSQPTIPMLALYTLYSFVYSLHIQLTCVVENNNLMLSGS